VFRGALRLLLAAALGAALLLAPLAQADTYRWVDGDGATHYAPTLDEVPRAYRDSAQLIPAPPAGIPNPSHSHPPPRSATPAPAATPAPVAPVEPPPPAANTAPPGEPQPSAVSEPVAPDAPAEPNTESPAPPPVAPPAAPPEKPVTPLPDSRAPKSGDPRQDEIAELQGRIEADREVLRQLISTPRWDASEMASDPQVREIAERLPRLQAELAALRSEGEH
jgi:outer membrane biosynthesis protein TonB